MTASSLMSAAGMDKHWNLSYFHEDDAAEPIAAVHICAYSDRADMYLPRARRDSDHDPIFDSDDEGDDAGLYQDGLEIRSDLPNHWALLLELRHGQGRGVKLEMAPSWQAGRPAREGTVLVSSLAAGWRTSESIVKSLRFDVVPAADVTTVQQVIENLGHNARHRYLFTEGGEGSRYWVYTVVRDLEAVDTLQEGDADVAEEALSMIWSQDRDAVAGRVRRGMFTEWTIRGEKKPGFW
ncbi:hypothetical protein V2A60_002452 [Cordyceps javanica]